ncbi:hypothetical protein EDD21DRAFT_382082 [Dissophora ornata]|nr:hypothetical protein EDD21DRAFT_382082 [Dissophora ornata]
MHEGGTKVDEIAAANTHLFVLSRSMLPHCLLTLTFLLLNVFTPSHARLLCLNRAFNRGLKTFFFAFAHTFFFVQSTAQDRR